MRISELGLSRRTINCLYRADIRTVEELKQKHEWELQSIRSFGPWCLNDVKMALERLAQPKTNADRIRAMSDDELANMLYHADGLGWCKNLSECVELLDNGGVPDHKCIECLARWLKQEVESDAMPQM